MLTYSITKFKHFFLILILALNRIQILNQIDNNNYNLILLLQFNNKILNQQIISIRHFNLNNLIN